MLTFSEFGLKPEIIESIANLGFITPTPIQAKTIPYILSSDGDLVAMAQTGTGKTAAFGLPLLNKMERNLNQVQTIILCPTRELCLQITSDLVKFNGTLPFTVVPVYGGAPIYQQVSAIKKKCDIVVGTPGRVNDLIQRDKLDLSGIRFLVLDEADEMLKMGFREEMDAILEQTPESKQTLLFSATMPPDINRIAGKYMRKPASISVSKQNVSNSDISHEYCVTAPQGGYQALRRIADINPDIYSIVFCRTRQETKEIADRLMNDGYNADALHGDLSQAQRDHVMGRFRNRLLQILVATDVAARGLDVDNLTHVIHFHLPDDPENYIHRSGRTGRAGKKGVSIAILTPSETRRLSFLERQAGNKFVHRPIPSGAQVFEKRLASHLQTVVNGKCEGFNISDYSKTIEPLLGNLSREEIIDKFIAYSFNSLHEYYFKAPDLNISKEKVKVQPSARLKPRGEKFARYCINLGSKNDLRPEVLIGIINRQTPDRKIEIGRIDIQSKISIFEAGAEHEQHLLKAFKKARFKGAPIMVQALEEQNNFNANRNLARKKRYN